MPAKYNPGPLAQQRSTLRTPAAAAQFALSAWSAVLQKKWTGTGMQEFSDAYQAINKLSFTQSIPDSAVVANESSSVVRGKNSSWALSLNFYAPLQGYILNIDAKNKKLVANKTLLGLLKNNDLTRRSRTAPTFSSSAPINDPQQILDLLQFLHKQSPATVSPELAPFAKEVVKADFDITEAKRGSTGLTSRAGVASGGQTVAAVRSQLVTLEGINVQVVQSVNQLPVASAPSDVEGVWYSGTTVYLVADNLPNAARVQQVLAHEAIGHAAMEAMLGPKLMAELINNVQNLEKTGHRLVREVAAQVDRTQPGLPADRRAKEIIAVMAERGEHVKGALWQRTLYAVRQWLRSKGFDIAFSESDVLAALRDAETFAKRGPAGAEFKAWFGNSKIVDKNGEPLAVYHGSPNDISEFKSASWIARNFGNLDDGFFFTESPVEASLYATNPTNRAAPKTGGAVYKVYLSLQNPAVNMSVEAAKKAGHDGVIYTFEGSSMGRMIVAFNANQIKSVFNEKPTDSANIKPKYPQLSSALFQRPSNY
jgi:hypothetical protein